MSIRSIEKERIERDLQNMITDKELDSYNRLLLLYVYRNFISYLPEIEQTDKLLALSGIVQTLPKYINQQIKLKEE